MLDPCLHVNNDIDSATMMDAAHMYHHHHHHHRYGGYGDGNHHVMVDSRLLHGSDCKGETVWFTLDYK